MDILIGFHFIATNTDRDASILKALNDAGITVDGNQIESVYDNVCRVWTEGTLQAFHDAADLLIGLNSGGPVMFTAGKFTELECDVVEWKMNNHRITFDDGALVDGEIFAFCESADHIRILTKFFM